MIMYIALAVLLAVIIYSKQITNLFVIIFRKMLTKNACGIERSSIPSLIS